MIEYSIQYREEEIKMTALRKEETEHEVKVCKRRQVQKQLEKLSMAELLTISEAHFICSQTDVFTREYYNVYLHAHEAEYKKLFLDVNFLKEVNDCLGHEAGDKYLKSITQVVQDNIRKEDVLIRWNRGDEFVLFVRAPYFKEAVEIKERLDSELAKYNFSVAIGIGNTIEEADKDMYKDKEIKKLELYMHEVEPLMNNTATIIEVNTNEDNSSGMIRLDISKILPNVIVEKNDIKIVIKNISDSLSAFSPLITK